MPKKKKTTPTRTRPDDWRKRPRKPAHLKRSEQIGPFCVTLDERTAILARAEAAGLTIRDFMVGRALAD